MFQKTKSQIMFAALCGSLSLGIALWATLLIHTALSVRSSHESTTTVHIGPLDMTTMERVLIDGSEVLRIHFLPEMILYVAFWILCGIAWWIVSIQIQKR